jgi:hypothetical protein
VVPPWVFTAQFEVLYASLAQATSMPAKYGSDTS